MDHATIYSSELLQYWMLRVLWSCRLLTNQGPSALEMNSLMHVLQKLKAAKATRVDLEAHEDGLFARAHVHVAHVKGTQHVEDAAHCDHPQQDDDDGQALVVKEELDEPHCTVLRRRHGHTCMRACFFSTAGMSPTTYAGLEQLSKVSLLRRARGAERAYLPGSKEDPAIYVQAARRIVQP